MAYTTGVATTAAQVLDGIQAGALAGGWTLSHRGPDTGGGTLTGYRADILWVTNGSYCLGFSFNMAQTPVSELQVYWASSFSGSLQYTQQAGYLALYSHWVYVPCRKWHVFSTIDNVYVVIEGNVNSFRHTGGGMLIKQDNYVGGAFLHSHRSYSSSSHNMPFGYTGTYGMTYAVRVAGDGYTERWRYNDDSGYNFPDELKGSLNSNNALADILISGQNNQFNRQTILVPLYTFVTRAGGLYSPIGYPPHVRGCNIKYLNPAGETITLGPDTWMVFPIGMVGSADARDNPDNHGLAYLVN